MIQINYHQKSEVLSSWVCSSNIGLLLHYNLPELVSRSQSVISRGLTAFFFL